MNGDREEILAEGAARLEAVVLEAQQHFGTDGIWAVALEAERIRAEVEAATGVSLVEPMPEGALADALAFTARGMAEEAERFLGGAS